MSTGSVSFSGVTTIALLRLGTPDDKIHFYEVPFPECFLRRHAKFVLLNLTAFELNVTVPFKPMREHLNPGATTSCVTLSQKFHLTEPMSLQTTMSVVSLALHLHPSGFHLLHSDSFRLL